MCQARRVVIDSFGMPEVMRLETVELPICEAEYQILYENADPRRSLEKLFSRSLRNEFV